jgi:hypothetical protein
MDVVHPQYSSLLTNNIILHGNCLPLTLCGHGGFVQGNSLQSPVETLKSRGDIVPDFGVVTMSSTLIALVIKTFLFMNLVQFIRISFVEPLSFQLCCRMIQ